MAAYGAHIGLAQVTRRLGYNSTAYFKKYVLVRDDFPEASSKPSPNADEWTWRSSDILAYAEKHGCKRLHKKRGEIEAFDGGGSRLIGLERHAIHFY